MHFATCIYMIKGHTGYIQAAVLDTKMSTNRQFRLEAKSLCSKTRLPRFKPRCINLSTLVLRLKKYSVKTNQGILQMESSGYNYVCSVKEIR